MPQYGARESRQPICGEMCRSRIHARMSLCSDSCWRRVPLITLLPAGSDGGKEDRHTLLSLGIAVIANWRFPSSSPRYVRVLGVSVTGRATVVGTVGDGETRGRCSRAPVRERVLPPIKSVADDVGAEDLAPHLARVPKVKKSGNRRL